MDARRIVRYKEKVDHAAARLSWVGEWLDDAGRDPRSRLASYKAFQEAAEAVADLTAMALTDHGEAAKDDHRNLDAIASHVEVGPDVLDAVHRAFGLRNRLVHEYDRLDDAIAIAAIGALAPHLSSYVEVIARWLSSKT